MERVTDIANLADEMTSGGPPTMLRIAVITAIQASLGRRVQTSATDGAWIPRSQDSTLVVGDRVWLIQQGNIFVVGGRLSGEPGSTPIGTVVNYAGITAPDGWLICDGSAVSRTTYATLFAVMNNGVGYGTGDGSTTFNLPDLRGRMSVGTGPSNTRGSTGGASTVTLTTAQIPNHDHGSAGAHTHTAGVGTAAATVMTGTGASVANSTAITTSSSGAHTHTAVGSGSSHENMSPYQVLLPIIRAI